MLLHRHPEPYGLQRFVRKPQRRLGLVLLGLVVLLVAAFAAGGIR